VLLTAAAGRRPLSATRDNLVACINPGGRAHFLCLLCLSCFLHRPQPRLPCAPQVPSPYRLRGLPYRSCQKRQTDEPKPGRGLGRPGRARQRPQLAARHHRPLTMRPGGAPACSCRRHHGQDVQRRASTFGGGGKGGSAPHWLLAACSPLLECCKLPHAHPRSLPCCVDLRAGCARCAAHHPAPARLLGPRRGVCRAAAHPPAWPSQHRSGGGGAVRHGHKRGGEGVHNHRHGPRVCAGAAAGRAAVGGCGGLC
jgi:hypothetical protein